MLSSIVLSQTERSTDLIFETDNHYFDNFLSDDLSGNPYSSINFFGKPLVIYNIEKLTEAYGKIRRLSLPSGMPSLANMITNFFPDIQIDEYEDSSGLTNVSALKIPLNSVIIKSPEGQPAVSQIVYPWDILKVIEYVLQTEVVTTKISKDASIEVGSVIDGPCWIDPGVSIDSFCKIKGPAYIGTNSRIGTGSLVRNSMLDHHCTVGFSCEVARSYVGAHDTFPHYDAILDSIVGEHTWMGGYVAITNVMLKNKQVMYKIEGKLVETGLFHFGAVIGHHSVIGAATVILPGRYLPPASFIPPHVLFSSIEDQQPAGPRIGSVKATASA
jgi:UDP-N-acetylglucosamine diphosphorylase / glucose-1-phosphate thymidylyltransferase / UDP-N-acetylgalactosamine diphosphorylase / glucosamine-1-phosphate N-acetyltransferase / galactosamine-1-phosphate N-acetyltransferase